MIKTIVNLGLALAMSARAQPANPAVVAATADCSALANADIGDVVCAAVHILKAKRW